MSADNGIYILPVTCEGKQWFYVKHMQGVDYLYDGDTYDRLAILHFTITAKRYSKETDALHYANNLARRYPVLEYGISTLPVMELK